MPIRLATFKTGGFFIYKTSHNLQLSVTLIVYTLYTFFDIDLTKPNKYLKSWI